VISWFPKVLLSNATCAATARVLVHVLDCTSEDVLEVGAVQVECS
jgi:hypothetical protein